MSRRASLLAVLFIVLAVAAFGLTWLLGNRNAGNSQANASDDWPAFMNNGERTGSNSGEVRLSPDNATNLKLLWRQKIGDGKPLAAQPIVKGNTVYIGSWDGFLYALNKADGSVLWKKDLGLTTSKRCFPQVAGISSSAAVTDKALFIGGGDDKLYALNPQNGDVLWTFKTGDNSEAGGAYNWVSPMVYNGRVYYGMASLCDNPFTNGRMWGLNAETGKVEQEVHFVPDNQLGGGLWTSPSVDQSTGDFYVTTGSADFYIPHAYSMARLDPRTLAVVDAWQIPIEVQVFDGDWGTTPTLFHDKDGKAMVGASAKNGYYYAFQGNSISTGPAWSVKIADGGTCPQCGEGAISSSVFANDTVYVAAGYFSLGQVQKFPGTVQALDPTNGAIRWIHPTSGWVIAALAAANGLVVAAGDDTVEVLNASTGEVLWDYATEATIYAAPTIAGGVLYVASTDGNLYAFGAGPYPDNPTAYKVGQVGSNPPGFTPFRTPVAASPATDSIEQCFGDTKKCVGTDFLAYWREKGGPERFGPAVTGELVEAGRTVQYFRNAVLELHHKADGTGSEVRVGRLDFRLEYFTPKDERFEPSQPISSTTSAFVPETQHNLSEPFLTYWREHGDVASLGYPVSEPFDETNLIDLQSRRVQYFERSRLEIVKAADGSEHVAVGALGLWKYKSRYGVLP